MKPLLRLTNDGSNTLYLPGLDEGYHSFNGAIQESLHVFITEGFLKVDLPVIKIFEVGFGTGLNALLTWLAATRLEKRVIYQGIEMHPLEEVTWQDLNYPEMLGGNTPDQFRKIHRSLWGQEVDLDQSFRLCKIHDDIQLFKHSAKFNLVYFDAFAPDKQPEMWTEEIFQRLFNAMEKRAVLVTYSSKSSIRRRLSEIGFQVAKVKGPPGKIEMIRATRN